MRILATKKVLVPLATAAVAGALAVGSGADFSSTSGNTASTVTAGTLAQTNSKAGSSILSLANMKPGDSVYGAVTITNSGSLGSVFSVTQTDTSTFSSGVLTEKIEDVTNASAPVTVYSGAFGEAHTYRITVTLASSATNTEQGKSASATFSWNGTQTSATVTNADTGAVTPAA